MSGPGGDRPLRADAERSVRAVLEAAERVLAADPTATMEEIARAAGVSRATVHRRFATREALLAALTAWAIHRFHEAVDAARPESVPPLVALYQVTANVLRVKIGWGYALGRAAPEEPEVARVHAEVLDRCDRLFRRAAEAGVLRPGTDPVWARRVYYALIHEVVREEPGGERDPDRLAALVVDTLLRGVGGPGAVLDG